MTASAARGRTARAALADLAAGRTSAAGLVASALEGIAAAGDLRAFVALDPTAAAQAEAADRARAEGSAAPLLGLPVAVKDDTDVAGMPTRRGTGSAQPVATQDDPLVSRLREAGAVVVGKTALPELALWGVTSSRWTGSTRNPLDPERTPGGSSGGSAAAVAAGLVPLATGTDGLGSLRIPAAACGLTTLKATRGRVPQRGSGWHGMSEAGLLAGDVADLELGLSVIAGISGSEPGTPRVGWTTSAPLPVRLHPEVRAAVDDAVRALAELGCPTRPVTVDYGQRSGVAALVRTWLAGTADERERLAQPHAVEPRTAQLAALGARARRWLPWALAEGERLRERVDRLWDEVDVLLLPAVATLPPRADALEGRGLLRTVWVNAGWGPFTGAFNATGHPAAVLPVRAAPGGLPVAVQLVGPHGSDERLLGLARALESVAGLRERAADAG